MADDQVIALRDGFYAVVNDRLFGPWEMKGYAEAGLQTEQRRARALLEEDECDVEGCHNETSAQGGAWRESGYWHTCSDHSREARNGDPRPVMKLRAVYREEIRKEHPRGFLANDWQERVGELLERAAHKPQEANNAANA